MIKPKLINSYIAKTFLIKFLQISLGFSLLIFFINLIETMEKVKDSGAPTYVAAFMAFLQIPDFLNDIVSSLALLSAIITFSNLSSKSEITIIRMSGFSIWQILRPAMLSAFLLGIFWIAIFEPVSIKMGEKFNSLEGEYIQNETRDFIAPSGGIWLKQPNSLKKGEELIFQAKKVYSESLELNNVSIWFFDPNGQFYKKIDAQEMILNNGEWQVNNAIVNSHNVINKKIDDLSIPTKLEADFVRQKIVNNFQNAKLFTIFALPSLIENLQEAGFNPKKFKVYMHSLFSKPLLFTAMTLIACYFGLNHVRKQNSALMIFLGIIAGLIFYIISSIMVALGSSGIISIFASTWVIAIVMLSIGVLMIYRKESL